MFSPWGVAGVDMIANTNCLPLLCVCLSPQLCIALNDIEQVRHGVHELPEFVALDNLKADLRDKGEPLADEVEGNINVIMTEMGWKDLCYSRWYMFSNCRKGANHCRVWCSCNAENVHNWCTYVLYRLECTKCTDHHARFWCNWVLCPLQMRPGIKAGLKRVSEAQKSDNFDDVRAYMLFITSLRLK